MTAHREWTLHRQAQEYYALPDLTATPVGATTPATIPAAGWEASFDGGTTWHPSAPHPDLPAAPAWLLRGPSMPGTGDISPVVGIPITRSIVPLIRLRDAAETAITSTAMVRLWG